MKYVSNYCVQRCDTYVPFPSICNQLIPIIDINVSIDCYWKSMPIDNHTNLAIDGSSIIHININWLIDIDWHRLSLLSIGYPGIVGHMTSFVQKILVDSNQQEFAMKQTRNKDLVGIVTFDLIGVLPTDRVISYFTRAYQSLWGNLWC